MLLRLALGTECEQRCYSKGDRQTGTDRWGGVQWYTLTPSSRKQRQGDLHESRTAWSVSIVRFRLAKLHSETLSVAGEGVAREGVGNGENVF